MTGISASEPSGWTVDTLKEHFEHELAVMTLLLDERAESQHRAMEAAYIAQVKAMDAALAAAEKAVSTALISAEKAVVKAEISMEKRFDGANGFRAQLAEQANSFTTRIEMDSKHDAVIQRVDTLDGSLTARVTSMEVSLGKLTPTEMTMVIERTIQGLASRREMLQGSTATEEKFHELLKSKDKEHDAFHTAINANALAIERANAAGQTIYVLRGEAANAAKAMDDKISSAISVAAANHKLITDAVADLRQQLADTGTRFMPRTESETRTLANTERVREIEIRMQSYPTRDETAVALNAADAKFATGIGTITEKTNNVSDRLAALDLRLSSRLDLSSGKGQGASQLWAIMGGALALLISVILLANAFLGK